MLDTETINKLKQVRVIDKATGALKRIDIDNKVETELKIVESIAKGLDRKAWIRIKREKRRKQTLDHEELKY